MSEPLVSVMLPAYHQVDFVREAIESAADQNYSNLEVVVSDDGSTDGTVDIILECARKYPGRVVSLVNQPHLGITGNCNRNLKACKGKYVAFSAGDDVYLPGKIKTQVEWMEENQGRVLCGHDVESFDSISGTRISLFSDKGRIIKYGYGPECLIENHGLYPVLSFMVRANAIPEYGYDERIEMVSDWKFFIDILMSGKHFGYIDKLLARYRIHKKSMVQRSMDYIEDAIAWLRDDLMSLAILETEYPHLSKSIRKSRSKCYCSFAVKNLKKGRNKIAKAYFIKSILTYPFGWKKAAYYFSCFLPNSSLLKLYYNCKSNKVLAIFF